MQLDNNNNLILNIKNKTQLYSEEEIKKALEDYQNNKVATNEANFCANHNRDTEDFINNYYMSVSNEDLIKRLYPIKKPLKVYLAIPYTGIEESSYNQATEATMLIINEQGHNVFSPITHSHPIAKLGVKGTWDFWQHIDYQYIDWADEVWVLVPKEGIQKCFTSTGVVAEIKYATKNKKIVKFIHKKNNKIIETYGSC